MSDKAKKLVERLIKEKAKTLAFFNILKPEDWQADVYSEGAEWTTTEVLAHLVSSEDGVARLIAHIVDGGDGVPVDFDLNRYNERKVNDLEADTPDELLHKFAAYRDKTVGQVAAYTDLELRKRGRHPFLGDAEVEDMVKLMYRHALIHQRELRRALK